METTVKKNYILNVLYQILNIIIPLVTTPYLSRILGATGIGNYSYAYAIAYYFVIFSRFGLNDYGNRSIAAVRDKADVLYQTFGEIYSAQIITSAIAIVVYIAFLLCGQASIYNKIMLLYVLSGILDVNWFFFGLEQFKVTVTRNAAIKILSTLCIFVFVKDSSSASVYCIIMATGVLLSQIVLWPFVFRYVGRIRLDFRKAISHLKPMCILFIPVVAVSLYKYMDKIMLGALRDSQEVGFYESAERVLNVPLAFITALGTVMLPKAANLLAKGKSNQVRNNIRKSMIFAAALSSAMSLGIASVAKEFVPLFFGEGFELCINLFYILMPSCIFVALSNVLRTQYLIPNKRDKEFVISVLIGAVLNFGVNYLLIPEFGAMGAAIGTFVAEFSVWFVQNLFLWKELPILEYLQLSFIISIPSLVMILVVRKISLYVSGLTGLIGEVFAGMIAWGMCAMILFFVLSLKNRRTERRKGHERKD